MSSVVRLSQFVIIDTVTGARSRRHYTRRVDALVDADIADGRQINRHRVIALGASIAGVNDNGARR